jgi:hypothetical protein
MLKFNYVFGIFLASTTPQGSTQKRLTSGPLGKTTPMRALSATPSFRKTLGNLLTKLISSSCVRGALPSVLQTAGVPGLWVSPGSKSSKLSKTSCFLAKSPLYPFLLNLFIILGTGARELWSSVAFRPRDKASSMLLDSGFLVQSPIPNGEKINEKMFSKCWKSFIAHGHP